jgi:hypothetical protein
VSVAVLNGRFLPDGGRSFSVHRVGRVKCKHLLSRMTVSVTRGVEGSGLMTSHRWMMMGNQCSRVSGVAVIMIVSMWRMLSDMRKGR